MLFPRDEYYLIDDILDESAAGVAPRASLHPAAEHFFSKLAGDNPCQIKPDRGYRGYIGGLPTPNLMPGQRSALVANLVTVLARGLMPIVQSPLEYLRKYLISIQFGDRITIFKDLRRTNII